MVKPPSWYDRNERQDVEIDGLASDPRILRRLALLSDFGQAVSELQERGRQGRIRLADGTALPSELFDFMAITEVASPSGTVKVSRDPTIPPQILSQQKDSTWYRAAPHIINRTTKRPIQAPIIVKAPVFGKWTDLSPYERDGYNKLFTRFIQEVLDIPIETRISNAVSRNREYISMLDPAPDPESWNAILEMGYGHRKALGALPEDISDTFIGKANKRMRALTEGGDHFYTEFPDYIGPDANVIPVGGEYGMAFIQYDVVDNPVAAVLDADGNVLTPKGNTTDGGGDMRRSMANQIYRAIHGVPLPAEVGAIQINWTGRAYTAPNGGKIGGVWKMLATIVPDRDYDDMLRRDGMDPNLSMRISSDALANQHDNPKAASGRIIWHQAKPKMFKDVAVGGLLSLPNAGRYFDMEQFYEYHIDHVVDELIDQVEDFEGRIPTLSEDVLDAYPEFQAETEMVDSPLENTDAVDYERMKQRQAQARMAEQFEALTTDSPYASSGLMDLAQRMRLKLDGMERSAKGANAIFIPMWKGKRMDAADFPGWVEPERGVVRLLSLKHGAGYINWMVFNREDMLDPLMQKKFDGPDNDDEFGAKLARDPARPGKLFAHVTRDPQSIGGGDFLEVDARDIPEIMRNKPVIFESFADARANGELHPDMVNILGMEAEAFPEEYLNRMKLLLATGRTADYARAWELYDSLVTGMGNTQMVTNFDALAYNSGWIDSEAAVERWYTNLSNIVDAENGGTGTGRNIMWAKAQLAVEEIEAGKLVDAQLLQARPGYQAYMLQYVAQRAEARNERVGAAITAFRTRLAQQQGSTEARRRQRQVVNGAQGMADAIENINNVMANGPHQWLTAAVQQTPPTRWAYYILPEVDYHARQLSDTWHSIYATAQNHIGAEWEAQGLVAEPGTPDTDEMRVRRKEIEDLWTQRAWNKIDQEVIDTEALVSEIDGYKRGMLFASLKQHETIKRAGRTIGSGHSNSILLDQTGTRVTRGFSHEEKMGYYQTRRTKVVPTVVMQYEGTPWLHLQRSTGKRVDSRRVGFRPSRVRYQRHEHRIGPYTILSNPHATDFMDMVSALGGEFVYQGDVARRRGYGVWEVIWRKRIYDAETGKYLTKTREKMRRWLHDRFIVNVPVEAIPDMFTNLSDLENLVYQTATVSGRQQIVHADYIQYQAFAFPDNQIRTEFPNEPYTIEIPDHVERRTPQGRDKVPLLRPVPEVEGPELARGVSPFPERRGEDNILIEVLDDLNRHQQRAEAEAQESVKRQHREGNRGYKPPKPSENPDRVAKVGVGRTGGRDDAFVLLKNLLTEMQETIQTFSERDSWQAARLYHRRTGLTAWTDLDTGQPLHYLDEVWFSPTLGNYTSVRDVTRGWQDYGNWAAGQHHWYSPAGVQHAVNRDEAASFILKDMYMRAEHRLIEREERGFWYYDAENKEVRHSGDKTHEVGQRVTGKMAMRALMFGAGTYGIYPEVRYWTNRRMGVEKAVFDYMRELEIPVPFDGDPVAVHRASRQELDAEVARMTMQISDDIGKMAVLNSVIKDMRGVSFLGQDFSPGIIQTLSETQDLAKEIAESGRALWRHFESLIDGNIEVVFKQWARNGMENVMEGLGYQTLDPSMPLMGDISPEPEIPERLRQTWLEQDRQRFNSVVSNFKEKLNQGDFFGAGLAGADLLNLRMVNWFTRHNRLYTYWSPSDLRSPGSLIPIARGTGALDRVYGLLNMDAGVQDRSWNNAWLNIKEAMKRSINQNVQKTVGEFYTDARRGLMDMEDGFQKRTGIRLSIARKMWESNPMYNPRARVGASVLLIHRIRWYRAISEGYGAKVLSRTLENHNVPVRKRWLTDSDPCSTCRRNGRQGWMMNDENFASGHNQPPAHPGCDCKLRLSVDDRSNMGKVLRPITQPRFMNVNRMQRRQMDLNPMRFRVPRVMRDVQIPAPPVVMPSIEI